LEGQPGALLPILHGIQGTLGHIPESAVPIIAQALQQTRADVHGVISFYEDFRTQPGGRHRLQICRAEACQARGCAELENYTQQKLGVGYGQTTRDGEITLDPVYCLGNCAAGPSVRVGDRVLGRVTPARMDRLVEELTTVPLTIQPAMASHQSDASRHHSHHSSSHYPRHQGAVADE
jgi:formate dehydrogenase subunit gamma